MSKIFDVTIVGAGIVGLATARELLKRHPLLKVCVLEKDSILANHQSRRNSGVIHRGIYYKPGSLKSKFCTRGARLAKEYCQEKNIPIKPCGKLIVATRDEQLEGLHKLFENAKLNGIHSVELYNRRQATRIQPGCDKLLEAIWSPETAVVDWHQVALSYAADFEQSGGTIMRNFLAIHLESDDVTLTIKDDGGEIIQSKALVNCAGLQNDFFVRCTGNSRHPSVVPFKGNYFMLSDRMSRSIKTNIYPVPDPDLPFLGVHITPRVDGSVLLGPTALLTLGYENYNDSPGMNPFHMFNILFRTGLKNLIMKKNIMAAGLQELRRYLSKKRFADEVREFMPLVNDEDLISTDFCGIRAQLVHKDGELVDDFLFEPGYLAEFRKVLHVRNCPSPAATSSLAIGERIVDILEDRFI